MRDAFRSFQNSLASTLTGAFCDLVELLRAEADGCRGRPAEGGLGGWGEVRQPIAVRRLWFPFFRAPTLFARAPAFVWAGLGNVIFDGVGKP